MAGNRVDEESEESEIVQILKDVSVVREIESRYRSLAIRDIRQDLDLSACFVKGKATKKPFASSALQPRGRIVGMHFFNQACLYR